MSNNEVVSHKVVAQLLRETADSIEQGGGVWCDGNFFRVDAVSVNCITTTPNVCVGCTMTLKYD